MNWLKSIIIKVFNIKVCECINCECQVAKNI